jgi:hypothetical protein
VRPASPKLPDRTGVVSMTLPGRSPTGRVRLVARERRTQARKSHARDPTSDTCQGRSNAPLCLERSQAWCMVRRRSRSPPRPSPDGTSNTADQLRSGAPVRPAGGGTGRHLVLPFGCRPELRQLHPLVRQSPPTPHPWPCLPSPEDGQPEAPLNGTATQKSQDVMFRRLPSCLNR